MSEVLGKISFLDTPDVNGRNVILNFGGIPSIQADITSNLPSAVVDGQLFLDTTLNKFFRSNGTSWIDLTSVSIINGTVNQIDVAQGTNVSPSVLSLSNNPILPGLEGFVPPTGATADRPSAPSNGETRFNTSSNILEYFNGETWVNTGRVLQTVTGQIDSSSGTGTIPLDNTVPSITEGNLIWTQTFTPISANSKIIISFGVTASASNAARTLIMPVFANTTNIGAVSSYMPTSNTSTNLSFYSVYTPGNTSTITFSARLGANSGTTSYCNRTSAATLGGALVSSYTLMEIL